MHKKNNDTFTKRKSPAAASKKPAKNTKSGNYIPTEKPIRTKKQSARSSDAAEGEGRKKSYAKPLQDKPYGKKTANSGSFVKGKKTTEPSAPFVKGKRVTERPSTFTKDKSFTDKKAPYAKSKKDAAKAPSFRNKNRAPIEQEEPVAVYSGAVKTDDEMRLNKYLSHAGIASRRKADELIKEGKVMVNGQVITEMGYKIKPGDKVQFDNQTVKPERKYYVLLNKPKDFITTVSDERDRKTVMDLIHRAYEQIKAPGKPRLYPVGRLDRNTTGVLLITNDGELAQKLTHPSSEIRKTYHVVLDKKLRKEDFDKIAEGGVVLEDGIAEVDEIAYPNPKNRAEVGVEIHTGKNRFVRRIFESLGYEIVKLDRVLFAGLTKKDLPRGRWRFLNEQEVINLKHLTSSTR